MRNSVLTLLLLALLFVAIIAPFSALALLMLFTLVTAFLWAAWLLVRSFFAGDTSSDASMR